MTGKAHNAFITGAGKNIGRAVALELAGRGYNLVINGRADRAACEEVAAAARAKGVRAEVAMGDVGIAAEAQRLAADALKQFGAIDVFVANAAIRPDKAFLDTTPEDWQRVMGTNLEAAIWLSQAFLPGMLAQGWGRIVYMTGRNAMRGYAGHVTTSVAKHGLLGLTKTLAREYGPQGVTVNAISPGAIDTYRGNDATRLARLATATKDIPLRRLGTSEEIATVCGLLCSEEGAYVTGQMIGVNGGVET
jgi:3-oxoacyl-[acyl-carrier protein] reductase